MNGLYINQRAFEHVAADRTRDDVEILAIGQVFCDAFKVDSTSNAEHAQFISLMRKEQPSITL